MCLDRSGRTYDQICVDEYMRLPVGFRQYAWRPCHRLSGFAGGQDDKDTGRMHIFPGSAADGSGNVRLPDDPVLDALSGGIFRTYIYALLVPVEVQLDDLYGDHHRDGGRSLAPDPAFSKFFV